MVRYGLKQDIKIDLTLLDDMNDFKNIIEGVLIKDRFLYQVPPERPETSGIARFNMFLNTFRPLDCPIVSTDYRPHKPEFENYN